MISNKYDYDANMSDESCVKGRGLSLEASIERTVATKYYRLD